MQFWVDIVMPLTLRLAVTSIVRARWWMQTIMRWVDADDGESTCFWRDMIVDVNHPKAQLLHRTHRAQHLLDIRFKTGAPSTAQVDPNGITSVINRPRLMPFALISQAPVRWLLLQCKPRVGHCRCCMEGVCIRKKQAKTSYLKV